jgi:uncharacterized OB-fold protein
MTEIPPLPQPGPDSQEFWDGCRRHELRLQRCADCARPRFAPRPGCPHCGSLRFAWFTAAGRARVVSWTVVHGPTLPAFQPLVPYVAGVVRLEEGPHMVGQIRGCAPDAVHDGLRVRVEFDDVTPDVSLPHWRAVAARRRR